MVKFNLKNHTIEIFCKCYSGLMIIKEGGNFSQRIKAPFSDLGFLISNSTFRLEASLCITSGFSASEKSTLYRKSEFIQSELNL